MNAHQRRKEARKTERLLLSRPEWRFVTCPDALWYNALSAKVDPGDTKLFTGEIGTYIDIKIKMTKT